MAVKSVIEIEVQDGAFEKFAAQYRKYQDLLAKSPGLWNKTNLEVKKAQSHFQQMVQDRIVANEQAKLAAKAQDVADKATEREARSWRDMARSSKDFATNIGKATTSLLRWASLTTVISGIVGLGGLFGIDRLAAGVAAGRRSSAGLGMSIGEQSAFEVNYGRLVNPGFLGAVSEATSDASKRYALYASGLSERDIAGRSTGDVATALIQALKRKADATPTALLGQMLSTGPGQFIGLDEARRLKARGAGELATYGAGYGTDVRRLGLTDSDARKWENFIVKLDEAGKTIETGFIRKIAPLAPGLTALSESITRTIESLFGDSKRLNKWIEQFGQGIETFGKYLGSEKFQNDVKSFADAVGSLAESVVSALRALGVIKGAPPTPAEVKESLKNNNENFTWQDAIRRAAGTLTPDDPAFHYGTHGVRAGLPEYVGGSLPMPRPRPASAGLLLNVGIRVDADITITPRTGSATPIVVNQLPQ
jgi:hypothetical protein